MFFTFRLAYPSLLHWAIIFAVLRQSLCTADVSHCGTHSVQFLQLGVDLNASKPSLLVLNTSQDQVALKSATQTLSSVESHLRAASTTTIAACIAITLLVIIGCMNGVLWCVDPISGLVRYGIDEFGPEVVGVDVDVKYSYVSILRGIVDIRDLVVSNPSGYQTPYLLRAGRILVDLDSSKLYGSCCNLDHVTVSTIELQDVDIVLETKAKGIWGTSNVQEVIDFMEDKGTVDLNEKPPNLTLYELNVKNVRVHLRYDQLLGATSTIAIADMHYQSFSKQVGSYAVDDIIKIILKSILKSTLGAAQQKLSSGLDHCCD